MVLCGEQAIAGLRPQISSYVVRVQVALKPLVLSLRIGIINPSRKQSLCQMDSFEGLSQNKFRLSIISLCCWLIFHRRWLASILACMCSPATTAVAIAGRAVDTQDGKGLTLVKLSGSTKNAKE